jgi:hypothetical protein
MTTLVTPIKPFRAWQYRKGEPMPEWADWSHVPPPTDKANGLWLVELAGMCFWFHPAEFAERFRVQE